MDALGEKRARVVPGVAVVALLGGLAGAVLVGWLLAGPFTYGGRTAIELLGHESPAPRGAVWLFGPMLLAAVGGVVAWRRQRWLPLVLGALALVLPVTVAFLALYRAAF
jgi:hypothetical protein